MANAGTYANAAQLKEASAAATPPALAQDPQRIVDAYADMILHVSYTYLHTCADAEDICQEVFLRMLRLEAPFRSVDHERAWVLRTSINLCKDVLRRRASHPQAPLDEAAEPQAPAHATEDALANRDARVLRAVMALPEAMREAVYLHYYEGYAIAGVAAITGRTESSVAQSLSRARKKLRLSLKGDDDVFDFE